MVNITSQWQDPEILISFYKSTYILKKGRILKLLVHKFRSDISARFRDIAEKQVLAKLKPIVGALQTDPSPAGVRRMVGPWCYCATISV